MKRPLLLLLFLLTAHYSLLTAFGQGTPGTVRCPSQADTLDSLFRIKDAARTTLTGTLTPTSTTVPVSSSSAFPASGSIKVDDEVIFYSANAGTSFTTLVRGAAGTTAVSHNSGATVSAPILSVHHNTLAQAVICAQQVAMAAVPMGSLDTDTGLTANSDAKVATQKAVKSYIDNGLATKVPTTRTVNGHALSANVTVTKGDVVLGSVDNIQQLPLSYLDTDPTLGSNSDVKVGSQKALKSYIDTWLLTKVPVTTTVNGHALSGNATVTKSDVGLSSVPNVDATNAANISSGTLPEQRLRNNPMNAPYNAACDGTTNDTSAFAALITALGSAVERITMPAGRQCLVGNLTIPANITIDYTAGGAFKGVTGTSLSHPAAIITNPGMRIFYNYNASQATVAALAGVAQVDWWGTNKDGTTNDNAALQAALTAGAGGRVVLGPYPYLSDGAGLKVSDGTTLEGTPNRSVIKSTGISAADLPSDNTTRAAIYNGPGTISNVIFRNFKLTTVDTSLATRQGIELNNASNITFENLEITYISFMGIRTNGATNINIRNCWIHLIGTPNSYDVSGSRHPYGINLGSTIGATVTGNIVEDIGYTSDRLNFPDGLGIYLAATYKAIVSKNHVTNTSNGIKAGSGGNNQIEGNIVIGNSTGPGGLMEGLITIDSEPNDLVKGNTLDLVNGANYSAVLKIAVATDYVATDNIINRHAFEVAGIDTPFSTTRGDISHNTVLSDAGATQATSAIRIGAPGVAIVSFNTVKNAKLGITVNGATDVKIVRNSVYATSAGSARYAITGGSGGNSKILVEGNDLHQFDSAFVFNSGGDSSILFRRNYLDSIGNYWFLSGTNLRSEDDTDMTGSTSINTSYISDANKNTVLRFHRLTDALTPALDNTGTPSIINGENFVTGGTTAITDFLGGNVGKTISVLAKHSVPIVNGTPIVLTRGVNFNMVPGDTLTLTKYETGVWSEVGRQQAPASLLGYAPLNPANNLSDVASVATSRTNLGGTTIGQNLFTLTNPSLVCFFKGAADNSASCRTPAQVLSDIGAQAALGYTPEDAANKDTDSTMAANSDTKYPSQKAVKTALALKSPLASPSFTGTIGLPTGGIILFNQTGFIRYLQSSSVSPTGAIRFENSFGSLTPTIATTATELGVGATFAPSSGTSKYNTFLFTPTINQTGGANGTTRGLFIDPTITAAADWRSIEVSRGNVLFGTSSGNVGIGTTAPGFPLTINGGFGFTTSSSGAGVLADSATPPTVSSGFGTSPPAPAGNGTAAFTVTVGTGGTATGGVLTMPAATTGWNCDVTNRTAVAANRADQRTVQTATTTTTVTVQNQTMSTGAALAWAASDVLAFVCRGY